LNPSISVPNVSTNINTSSIRKPLRHSLSANDCHVSTPMIQFLAALKLEKFAEAVASTNGETEVCGIDQVSFQLVYDNAAISDPARKRIRTSSSTTKLSRWDSGSSLLSQSMSLQHLTAPQRKGDVYANNNMKNFAWGSNDTSTSKSNYNSCNSMNPSRIILDQPQQQKQHSTLRSNGSFDSAPKLPNRG
jgi:hypothetical protein